MKLSPSFRPARRQFVAAAAALALAPALCAQGWPSKPLRLIVAGPPGGSADIIARIVSEPLSRELGQPVIVDNRPGAGGVIAISELLQAPRDGHTFLVGVNSLVSEVPHIIKMRWDPSRELLPLSELARGGLVLVANPSVPARNLAELIAYAKARPGQVAYASYSPGTMSHVLGLVLNRAAGIELVHVGYKGSSPALSDVMAGNVPLMFDGLATSLPMIAGGKIKAFAVTTPARVPQLPDVPTFHELGWPQMDAMAWMALWSTPDSPAPVQARMRGAVEKLLSDPAARSRIEAIGLQAGHARASADMQRELLSDFARVGAVLKSIGFKAE